MRRWAKQLRVIISLPNLYQYNNKHFKLYYKRRTMKRIWNGEETIIDEIKRLVELREVLPCSIIKFYTHFSIGKEAFYFVTDPYESSNIEKLLMKLNRKGRAISPSKIIDFAMQILDALAFIHSRKIIHRDIKPK